MTNKATNNEETNNTNKEKSPKEVAIVDVMQVRYDQRDLQQSDPQHAVKTFIVPKKITTIHCDVFIAGGGTSGVAAALAACRNQKITACLTEDTDWLGGQMTSQGVSALDENYLVETSGANLSYQKLRTVIRDYYRNNYKLSDQAVNNPYLNPGNCWVSRLAFEPKVALKAIDDLLNPAIDSRQLQVFQRCAVVGATVSRHRINSVLTVNLDTEEFINFKAKVYIDATELGDLLKLSGEQYVIGAEDKTTTGEPNAVDKSDPELVQDYVFPFVVEFIPGTQNTIAKPPHYDEFNAAGKFSFDGFKMFEEVPQVNDTPAEEKEPFWTYRRLLDKATFNDPKVPNDVAVINWDSNDFRDHNILDKSSNTMAEYLSMAKACSMGFLYWLQTEAPRDENGEENGQEKKYGYPEIKLRTDVLGTADGLSKYPYIRESRRARTITTIKEQDITNHASNSARARLFDDSVGIGLYPIDIHGREALPGEMHPAKPFQIPLGALVPQHVSNLVLAAKNIGTTHITNGSYRLHPIEWGIGEAAGSTAVEAIMHPRPVKKVTTDIEQLRKLQLQLIKNGVPVYWYEDVPTNHPDFTAIQFLSITGIMRGNAEDLRFNPDQPVTRGDAAVALLRAFGQIGNVKSVWNCNTQENEISKKDAIEACVHQELLNSVVISSPDSAVEMPMIKDDLNWTAKRVMGRSWEEKLSEPITRSRFAAWLFMLLNEVR